MKNRRRMKNLVWRILFTSMLISGISCAKAQDTGIRFETGFSWQQIQAKAKTENKYIFVDCYATWCGPCKWMSKNIFPKKEVGDYFNAHFINVTAQMDKTTGDSQDVKDRYADADSLAKAYSIGDYPTYLFFKSDGTLIYRIIGSSRDVDEFIKKAQAAYESADQYAVGMGGWRSHRTDSVYLLKAFNAAKQKADTTAIKQLGEAYVESLHDLYTYDNLYLVYHTPELVEHSSDTCFKLILNHANQINHLTRDKILAERGLVAVIFNEEIAPFYKKEPAKMDWKQVTTSIKDKYPQIQDNLIPMLKQKLDPIIINELRAKLYQDSAPPPDWDGIWKATARRYPGLDYTLVLLKVKAEYYQNKKQWVLLSQTAYEIMRKYGDQVDSRTRNDMAWDYVFEHSDDPKILNEAAKWMKKNIGNADADDAYLDTYANLLYKTGQKDQAIVFENTAVQLAIKNRVPGTYLKAERDNLEKMKAGKSTWEE